jgi:hypothetical protein
VKYAEEVLHIHTLTRDQQAILRALREPPFRVLVPSAHDVGKTFVAAVAASWWFDAFNPGLVISTAPTERDVVDLLWMEIRLLRQRAGIASPFAGPRAPLMFDREDHYAKGFTARKGESFVGRHLPRKLFIFDEGNGIDSIYYTTTKTMCDPACDDAWLVLGNPTDTTSQMFLEDMQADGVDGERRWHRFRLSARDHPNITAELAGRPRPIPGAVSLAMFDQWVQEWCEPIGWEDRRLSDIEWPPHSGCWLRPGPTFQCRALGLWPDAGCGVWSPALWEACTTGERPPFPDEGVLPEIGCDCAMGKGEDFHAIHARWGAVSLRHETSNTMDAVRIAGRLKAVATEMAAFANTKQGRNHEPIRPEQIQIKIDDDGTGNAVAALLKREGFRTTLVSAATAALRPDLYPRRRDEIWFTVSEKAKAGLIYLGLLDRPTLARLRTQLLAPTWDLEAAGRRKVEPKDVTKAKIGRSPDDADSFNLSHCEGYGLLCGKPVPNPPRGSIFGDSAAGRQGQQHVYGS